MMIEEKRVFAVQVAEEAAAISGEGYRAGVRVEKKGAIDLLTQYDLAAEEHVRARIQQRFPTHRIVGEELENERGAAEGPVWYVDPIDGTTNFAHGHPFFCCAIAYYEGDTPVAGAVSAPVLGITWSAGKGLGATRAPMGEAGPRCEVSTTETLADSLCATGFPYDRWTNADNNSDEFALMLRHTRGIRRCGSAALDLCLVADGTYDLYWEQRLSPWDMCAGALIVQEAGGQLTDYDGAIADPRTGRVVASNGRVHAEALARLQSAR